MALDKKNGKLLFEINGTKYFVATAENERYKNPQIVAFTKPIGKKAEKLTPEPESQWEGDWQWEQVALEVDRCFLNHGISLEIRREICTLVTKYLHFSSGWHYLSAYSRKRFKKRKDSKDDFTPQITKIELRKQIADLTDDRLARFFMTDYLTYL